MLFAPTIDEVEGPGPEETSEDEMVNECGFCHSDYEIGYSYVCDHCGTQYCEECELQCSQHDDAGQPPVCPACCVLVPAAFGGWGFFPNEPVCSDCLGRGVADGTIGFCAVDSEFVASDDQRHLNCGYILKKDRHIPTLAERSFPLLKHSSKWRSHF